MPARLGAGGTGERHQGQAGAQCAGSGASPGEWSRRGGGRGGVGPREVTGVCPSHRLGRLRVQSRGDPPTRAWPRPSPRSARRGGGDMHSGGAGVALLASLLWVSALCQPRGEPLPAPGPVFVPVPGTFPTSWKTKLARDFAAPGTRAAIARASPARPLQSISSPLPGGRQA